MQYSVWKRFRTVEAARARISEKTGMSLFSEEIPTAVADLQYAELVRYEDPQIFHDAIWEAYNRSGVDGIYSLRGGLVFDSNRIEFPVEKDQIVIEFYADAVSIVHHLKGLQDLDLDLV